MAKIGMAVIGLGTALQPHAKSLADLADRIEVRWAASRSEQRFRAFTDQVPCPTTTDIDKAISDPAVDAILLLTPPSAHLELAERAFAAGKHVLVEKPLEISAERGRRLVAAGRAAEKRLGVVLQHRFRPASLKLAGLIRDGALGEIAAAAMSVPWWRPQSYYDEPGRGTMARDGGGVLLTQAVHTLDLFRSLADVTDVVAAQVTTTPLHRMETEDYVSALLRLRSGAPASMMATTAFYPGQTERIELIGTRGTASLLGDALSVRYLDGRGEEVASQGSTGSGANIMDFPHDAHRAVLTDFIDAIEGGRDPKVSGEEALATQELIERILAAGKSKA